MGTSARPWPTGAPYAVVVAERGAALVGSATLAGADSPAPAGRGLHSSTFQLNKSRV